MLKYIFNTEWNNTVWAAHRFPPNFIENQTHLKWECPNTANRFWIWSFVTNFHWNQFRFGSKNCVWKTQCWPSLGTECKLTGRSYILISVPTRYGTEWVLFMLASVYQSRRLWVCSGKSETFNQLWQTVSFVITVTWTQMRLFTLYPSWTLLLPLEGFWTWTWHILNSCFL